jgi:hypothetical protein
MGLFNFGQTEEEKAEKNRQKEEKKRLKQEAKEKRKKEEQAKIEKNRARSELFHKTKSPAYLLLDEEHKLFKISKMGNLLENFRVFSYDELQDYEIYENGSSVSKGGISAGRAIVGGALAGPAGLLLGGLSGKKKMDSVCDRLSVKFTTNGLHGGVHEIKLITQATKKDSFSYKSSVKIADEIIYTFDTILQEQNKINNTTTTTNDNLSVADELLKLKSLVDSGLLTQEEFESQKTKLLEK